MNTKLVVAMALASLFVLACGDSGSGSGGSSAGGAAAGGAASSGGASTGGSGTGGCPSGPEVGAAPWLCDCGNGVGALTDCAADSCDGQTSCEAACPANTLVQGFDVAQYVDGPECDAICGFVNDCCAPCEVYFRCGVDLGETVVDATARLACKANNAAGWSCDANGEPFYQGAATCN